MRKIVISAILAGTAAATPAQGDGTPVREVVVYRVTDPGRAAILRRQAAEHLAGYEGFVSWTRLSDPAEPTRFVDIAEWRTLADAQAAGAAVPMDPRFAEFLASIAVIETFGHFVVAD